MKRASDRGFSRRRRAHRGFTLLELFLTLSLAVVLMTLINSAFRFYAGDMDSSDADMRRTMLAASVMQMIEDDLRATLHPEPLDTSALEDLVASTAGGASGSDGGSGSGGAGSASEEGADALGMEAVDAGTEDASATGESLVDGVAVLETPGLIGNQFQIQLDTSRLPRLEEYAVILDANPGNIQDLPSDLKTVTYFVQPSGAPGVEDPLGKLSASDQAVAAAGGLVRRVLDRSATQFATESGNLAALNQTGEVLAPEVAAIEFSYWDGVTWQIEWDSDAMGELPLAVKISLSMIDPAIDANEQEPRLFQHVVRLPMAKMIEQDEESLDEVGS